MENIENMDIRARYIGPCSQADTKGNLTSIDLSSMILRLILFEKYILLSNNLTEFPVLVNAFGYSGVMDLLQSGTIQIQCEAVAVCQKGQTQGSFRGTKKDGTLKEPLPLHSYSFGFLRSGNYQQRIHDCLQIIHEIDGLHHKEKKKLKRAIADRLVRLPDSSLHEIIEQLKSDLKKNIPNIKTAVTYKFQEKVGSQINSDNFNIHIEAIDEDDFHVEVDLVKNYNLSIEESHEIVENALLAIGNLNQRIEFMRAFSALGGFRQGELRIFEEKISFLEDLLAPEEKEYRLKRILEWPEFPDLYAALCEGTLNIEKLMRIRESSECKEFCQWIWSANEFAERELKERLQSMASRLAIQLHSQPGKGLRWLATTGLGQIPGLGLVTSLIDAFILDKLLPNSGVITFLGRMYPSIFQDRK